MSRQSDYFFKEAGDYARVRKIRTTFGLLFLSALIVALVISGAAIFFTSGGHL